MNVLSHSSMHCVAIASQVRVQKIIPGNKIKNDNISSNGVCLRQNYHHKTENKREKLKNVVLRFDIFPVARNCLIYIVFQLLFFNKHGNFWTGSRSL